MFQKDLLFILVRIADSFGAWNQTQGGKFAANLFIWSNGFGVISGTVELERARCIFTGFQAAVDGNLAELTSVVALLEHQGWNHLANVF